MKGIKLGILGICFCLAGIALSTNNIAAFGATVVGFFIALVGCFMKDEICCEEKRGSEEEE